MTLHVLAAAPPVVPVGVGAPELPVPLVVDPEPVFNPATWLATTVLSPPVYVAFLGGFEVDLAPPEGMEMVRSRVAVDSPTETVPVMEARPSEMQIETKSL